MTIPFNKPYLSGRETDYIRQAVDSGKISGDGVFTHRCHQFFEQRYGFRKALLTTSCTDALEMAAILSNIGPGDEVIAPSYTFVSTVNAFMLRGARIVFADSGEDSPNIDPRPLDCLVTERTRVIVAVHYGGVACDMDAIDAVARRHGLLVIEDAAQAIEATYRGRPLGSIGQLAAFSFHETKNIISGEGGMLAVNDSRFLQRAEIIREKGTNRSSFFRGEVDKYHWVDIGSSFLPSDVIAAFLFAQLENIDRIQRRRLEIWQLYQRGLADLAAARLFRTPFIPDYASNNAHMFYLVCRSLQERTGLIEWLKRQGIMAVFHYLSLHRSPYFSDRHDGRPLPNADRYTDCLVRLPLFYELTDQDVNTIVDAVRSFYESA
jgi:dTDP-4-amino-4,6-dideoxygalactose transaminase